MSVLNEELRSELWRRFKMDQDLRTRLQKDSDNQELRAEGVQIDQENTAWMRQIIAQMDNCWPGKSLVGEDGAKAAWLLVQHADRDPEFQRQCLALMTAAGPDEVSPSDVAYLTDRVRVNAGQPQVYGTQFWTDPSSGSFGPRPIEDEAHVDERRAQVGLGPLEEYRQRMFQIHEESQKSRQRAEP